MPEFDAPEPVGGGSAETAQVGNMLGNLNPLDSKQMAHAENQSSQLLESAKGGGFRVNDNAAKPIRDALIEAYDDVLGILKEARVLAAEPQLGTGPYAQQVANHVRQSADGPQGILPVLEQLKGILQKSEQALKIAIDNYRETEAEQQSTFNGN